MNRARTWIGLVLICVAVPPLILSVGNLVSLPFVQQQLQKLVPEAADAVLAAVAVSRERTYVGMGVSGTLLLTGIICLRQTRRRSGKKTKSRKPPAVDLDSATPASIRNKPIDRQRWRQIVSNSSDDLVWQIRVEPEQGSSGQILQVPLTDTIDDAGLWVGSGSDCHVVIPDDRVPARQAKLWGGGSHIIVDVMEGSVDYGENPGQRRTWHAVDSHRCDDGPLIFGGYRVWALIQSRGRHLGWKPGTDN